MNYSMKNLNNELFKRKIIVFIFFFVILCAKMFKY